MRTKPIDGGFMELESGGSRPTFPSQSGRRCLSFPLDEDWVSLVPARPLWSLLRGEVWLPGCPREAWHSILVCPSLCPGPGHVAFISGLLCSLASRLVWPVRTLEGDVDPGLLPSGLRWVGSVSATAPIVSRPPSTPRLLELLLPLVPSGLGVGTHRAELGWPTVLACPGPPQVFALSSCVPANLSVPGRLGQFLTLGRNTISCAFTVLCPHLAVLSFCYNFFNDTTLCLPSVSSRGPG